MVMTQYERVPSAVFASRAFGYSDAAPCLESRGDSGCCTALASAPPPRYARVASPGYSAAFALADGLFGHDGAAGEAWLNSAFADLSEVEPFAEPAGEAGAEGAGPSRSRDEFWSPSPQRCAAAAAGFSAARAFSGEGWPLAPTDSLLLLSEPSFAFLEDDEVAPAGGGVDVTPAFATTAGASLPLPLSPAAEDARERAAAARARADAAATAAAEARAHAEASVRAAVLRGAPPPASPLPRLPPHAASPTDAPGAARTGRRMPRTAYVASVLGSGTGPSLDPSAANPSHPFFSRQPPRPVPEKENLPAKGAAATGGRLGTAAGAFGCEAAQRGRTTTNSKRTFGELAPEPPTEPPAKVPRRAVPPPAKQQQPPQQQQQATQAAPVNYTAHAEAAAAAEGAGGGRKVRRGCSMCGANKTPQWRMGPSGAKTLCNACGVRYRKDVQTGAAPPPPTEQGGEGGAAAGGADATAR